MQINERIKEAREKAGYTQREIAPLLNTTYQQIGKYERGIQEMTASRLKAFCEICNADANWILGISEYSIEN